MYLLCVRGNFAKGRIGELNFITYILRFGPTSEFIASSSSAFYSADFDCFDFRGVGFERSSDFRSGSDSSSCASVDCALLAGRPLFFG